MNQMNDPKQAYEERKKIKEEERAQKDNSFEKKKMASKFIKLLIWVAILVLIGYGIYAFIDRNIPKTEDLSVSIPIMGAEHIAVNSSHEAYNSNPPTSGPHYAQTARSGFREDVIADEHIVHNLEHGDIWIAYHPRVSDDVKKKLKKFAGAKVIITAREANETDIALAAWGRLDTLNLEGGKFPEQRIRDFINRYINKGPERVPGMSGGV